MASRPKHLSRHKPRPSLIRIWAATALGETHFWWKAEETVVRFCDMQPWPTTVPLRNDSRRRYKPCDHCIAMYVDDIVRGDGRLEPVMTPHELSPVQQKTLGLVRSKETMTMPSIDIRLDGDNAFTDWREKTPHHFTTFRMTGLRDGMASGKPSLMFATELPDGSIVVLETSALLLETSLRAFKARWGLDTSQPFEGQV